MIYVPNSTYKCYVVQDANTIRAYHSNPQRNQTITYTDYYINSHYMSRDNSQTFSSTATLPTCITSSQITDSVYYRNDFADILLIFTIMCLFGFYIPLKVFFRLFRRFQ